jgi:hypothetical protein
MYTYGEVVRKAVEDDGWQTFREGLKGKPTEQKLDRIRDYWFNTPHAHNGEGDIEAHCHVCVRVDNYLKALARGGQLHAGVDIALAVLMDFELRVRKD